MAQITEVTVSIGEVNNNPGVSVNLELFIGSAVAAQKKSEFQNLTGQDVDDFKAYVVFDCESNDRAEAVKGVFEALKEGAGGEVNPSENPLQFGLRMVTSEEGELPFAVNLDSSVHGSSVVLKVTLQDEQKEQLDAVYEMVSAQAGGIADLEQSIKLRFELGQRAEDVYRSDNWFIEALSSLLFDLKITLNQDLGEKVSEVASEMGVPDQIQAAAKSFGLFQGANLNLRFRSPNQLPSKLKEAAAKLLRKDQLLERFQELSAMLSNDRQHFDNLRNNLGGRVTVLLATELGALSFSAFAPTVTSVLNL